MVNLYENEKERRTFVLEICGDIQNRKYDQCINKPVSIANQGVLILHKS